MELPRRKGNDVYLPDGAMTRKLAALRARDDVRDLRVCIVYAFDFRTRMLPYWYADKRMAPCSVRTLGDVLYAAGFERTRIVLQQWTPNFKPGEARIDGQRPDILLVSAMQVHAEPAYDLVREAHRMGDERPLIVVGGPKAIYEPADYFELGPAPGVGADCVVTGEAFVLLDLLDAVLEVRRGNESVRDAFYRARQMRTLEQVPGLAYLAPSSAEPLVLNTGIQRLLRNLDELPLPDAGYRLLEPPHRGTRLKAAPLAPSKVRWYSPISSLIATQGCKFNCPYCPIPAVNQRTWRHKSPQRMAAEIKHIYENFGIKVFFGTDDNFFNNRDTVIALMSEIASVHSKGRSLGSQIRFYTEATQFDVHKNQDILPLCRRGGLRGIWFGIEDITAELVNKGQNATKTKDLFALLHSYGIQPMAMMIHSDGQPLRSPNGDLSGVLNQAKYLFEAGAVSYQCTYLAPAVGTRNYEPTMESGHMFRTVGGKPIPQAFHDGNRIIASRHSRPWERQMNVVRAYATFYNPVHMLRTLLACFTRKGSVAPKRFVFQIIGQIGVLMTTPKLWSWAQQLKRGPIERYHGMRTARIRMVDVGTGETAVWAIDYADAAAPRDNATRRQPAAELAPA